MKHSAINWTDHTFNPWIGCSKVSPGCDNCYAEALDRRKLHDVVTHWGPGVPRKIMSDDYWQSPLQWNKRAAVGGERYRVFCASMADVFDKEAPAGQRERLWALVRQTPSLDWLLLTKRPIPKYLPDDWGNGYPNVWLGCSVENRKHGLPRIDRLRKIPAAVRFLSIEPLLEDLGQIDLAGIHWVIIGGESGGGARPFDIEWAASVIEQCQQQNVPVWVKQLGRNPVNNGTEFVIIGQDGRRSGHADTFQDWPEELSHLRIRDLPHSCSTPKVDSSAVLDMNDQLQHGFNEEETERYLDQMDSELERLSSTLNVEAADQERAWRRDLIAVERRLFLNRVDKGRILLKYKGIYGPLRKWSEFLSIVGLPRQTSYELMAAARTEVLDRTDSVQTASARQPSTQRICLTIERNLAKLPPEEKLSLIRRLAIELGLINRDESGPVSGSGFMHPSQQSPDTHDLLEVA